MEKQLHVWALKGKFFWLHEVDENMKYKICFDCFEAKRNMSSVGKMFDELEWPSLEALRNQSSFFLFHKINCGAVSIAKRQVYDPCSRFENY